MTMREQVVGGLRRIRRVVRAHRFETGLGVAITAALILTVISLTIYKVGGFYRYDLSRPGYENERAGLVTAPSTVSLDTTSAITKQSAADFIGVLDKHRQNLEAYNVFSDGGLSDEDLQLTPPPAAP